MPIQIESPQSPTEENVQELLGLANAYRNQPDYDGEWRANPCLRPARDALEKRIRELLGVPEMTTKRVGPYPAPNNGAAATGDHEWLTQSSDFRRNLARSIAKYPSNAKMFDGLLGELHELKRAYRGDGDLSSEALDVAVCAYRIATEGDGGGNQKMPFVPDWMAWGADAPAVANEVPDATVWAQVDDEFGKQHSILNAKFPLGTKFKVFAP